VDNNNIKNKCIDIIMHYLKSKKNYIYFPETNDNASIINRSNALLIASKLSYFDLNASSFYFLKKLNNRPYEIELFEPLKESSFQEFNDPIINFLFCELSIFNFAQYFDPYQNNASLLQNLIISLELIISKNIICIVDLKKIFGKFGLNDESTLDIFINDILQNHESSFEEFLDIQRSILEEYDKKNSRINEMGIFYHASFYPSFFKRNTKIVAINLFKNWLDENDLAQNKKNYYQMLSLNEHSDYFSHFAKTYEDTIAYFNPFILLDDVFCNDFFHLQKKFEHLNGNSFINDFLDILNFAQFNIIATQQQSLLNSIFIYDSKDKEHEKKTSIKSFWEQSLDTLNRLYTNIKNPKLEKQILALKTLLKHSAYLTKYSNITINDFPFENYSTDDKIEIEEILSATLYGLNKNNAYSLKNIYNTSSQLIEQELINLKIKLSMDDKYFIRNLLKFMILDTHEGELSNTLYYNSKFKEIYHHFIEDRQLFNEFKERFVPSINMPTYLKQKDKIKKWDPMWDPRKT
jgi:hypothetical protein